MNGKLGNEQLLSGCGFVQNIAPPSLSRDRRIKMEQTNKQTSHLPPPRKQSTYFLTATLFFISVLE